MSKSKKFLVLVVLTLVGIQFIPNNQTEGVVNPIEAFETENEEVSAILNKACMDCHSNETVYPWYASVAPVSFFVNGHIEEGREHLNFSEWNTYSIKDREHVIEELLEVIEKKEMPMLTYWLVHWDAKITDEERQTLIDFFKQI